MRVTGTKAKFLQAPHVRGSGNFCFGAVFESLQQGMEINDEVR